METRKIISNSNKLRYLFLLVVAGFLSQSNLFSQNYEWELDKGRIREQEKKQKLDSMLVHLKNNWQISVSYGQWFFFNPARHNEESILDFPKNMSAWKLTVNRYVSESISVNVNLGIQIKSFKPEPDYFAIINGDDIEIEGGGLTFTPVSVGLEYYFMKQRFRPYIGVGAGTVSAKSKFVEGTGNMNDGIETEELSSGSSAPFIEISSGFVYRAGKNIQLGFECDYIQSKDFSKNIGGYKSYNGMKVSGVFSIIF